MTTRSLLILLWSSIHVLSFLAVAIHCLQRKGHASSTLLWIFIAWSFPFAGPIIYLCFGVDRVADRGFLKFLADEHLLHTRKKSKIIAPRAYWQLSVGTSENPEFDWVLDKLIPDHPAHAGNKIEPFVNGDEAYAEMLKAIRNARSHIHLQSFIIGNDTISHEFMDAMAEKANQGVKVRLLFDRFGSTEAYVHGMFNRYKKIKNFEIAGWTQANPLKRQFQINLRNHRKILVVDGAKAFFGGINLHEKNTSAHPKGPIRDYHFSTEGFITQELQYSFLRDWYFITNENPEILLCESHFPMPRTDGTITARLVNSGPSSGKDIATETFFNGITLAKKQILAVTPYFVPPLEILRAFHSAALRGVNVRLVVPKQNNHLYAGFASRAHYEDLLSAGVQIYERHPPFLHAKALIIDDGLCLVGTANIDHRSLNLNYETTVAIYSQVFVDRMKDIILEDISLSDEIHLNQWKKRPQSKKLLENLCLLMSPVI